MLTSSAQSAAERTTMTPWLAEVWTVRGQWTQTSDTNAIRVKDKARLSETENIHAMITMITKNNLSNIV